MPDSSKTSSPPDFRVLFESAPGLYLVLAPDLTIVAASEAYLRATMTKREAILGRGLFEVFPDNPDDPSATGVQNLRASLGRVLQHRASDAMAVQKYDIRRPESEGSGFEERYWSPVNSPVFGPGGEITYIIHRVEDVTEFARLKQSGVEQHRLTEALRTRTSQMESEIYQRAQEVQAANRKLEAANAALQAEIGERQQAEAELARFNEGLVQLVEERSAALQESERLGNAALDALTAHVAILDEHGGIIATNRTWRNFATQNGLPTAQASEEANYLKACDRAAAESIVEAAQMAQGIREIIAGRKPEFMLEYACHSPAEQRWFLCRVTRFTSGGPVRLVVAHENITQMKLLEKQQRRAQRLDSIGTLAGGIAHDLNNALAPIMMGMEMLRMKYSGESPLLDTIEGSTKRGADMVRQLLTFAKGAEGERMSVRPDRLIKEIQSMIKGSFPKNIQLVVKCDPQLPMVLGDATQLHQVLLNLCVNARDAMPHGGTLTLEADSREVDAVSASSAPDARPGKYVALRVNDTGGGIPPEILDHIFDPFFTTKGPDKGTGLGLSTVMGIVKGHGGFLQVHSQPGQGSTFTAYLPADRLGGVTEHLTKAEVEFRGQGETILLVDDEAAVREMSRAVLRRLNFKPLTATDGADGLMQAAEHRKELRAIITDLHMPHMDGLAFVRALRRMLPEIPVGVASGRMEDTVAAEFKELGVTNRLDKPFTEDQLAEALRNLLARK